MAKNNWTHEEHIVAFNLYCKIPFTKIDSNNKEIQQIASIIGRSSGSVAMKLANFARLDPVLQAKNISGLSQGAKGEEDVWMEFNGNWDDLAFESERILAKYKNNSIENSTKISTYDLPPEGKEREAIVKSRVNQSFFRKAVLASYDYKCCITGMGITDLLIAGHIIPWSIDPVHRTNPANGLCLNAHYDRAFDKGLMTITPDYTIIFSEILLEKISNLDSDIFIHPFYGRSIFLPQKFYPSKEFLEYHNHKIFQAR